MVIIFLGHGEATGRLSGCSSSRTGRLRSAHLSSASTQSALSCELHENHHNRATLPPGWQRIGADEFQLAMAPGWTIHDYGLRRVWPDARGEERVAPLLPGGQQQTRSGANHAPVPRPHARVESPAEVDDVAKRVFLAPSQGQFDWAIWWKLSHTDARFLPSGCEAAFALCHFIMPHGNHGEDAKLLPKHRVCVFRGFGAWTFLCRRLSCGDGAAG